MYRYGNFKADWKKRAMLLAISSCQEYFQIFTIFLFKYNSTNNFFKTVYIQLIFMIIITLIITKSKWNYLVLKTWTLIRYRDTEIKKSSGNVLDEFRF